MTMPSWLDVERRRSMGSGVVLGLTVLMLSLIGGGVVRAQTRDLDQRRARARASSIAWSAGTATSG